MPDDDAPRNPFVRWKQHVDASVSSALNGALGIPTVLSKNLELHRWGGLPVGQDDYRLFRYLWQPDPVLEEDPDRRRFNERMAWQRAHLGYDPAVNEFADFLQNSPYSPLNLGDLPPPVPSGCPPNVDPHGFTFADAFVDLMCSSVSAQTQRREELCPLDTLLSLNIKRRLALGHMEPTWPGWIVYYRLGLFDSFLREPNPPAWLEGTNTDRAVWQPDRADSKGNVQDWMAEAAKAYKPEKQREDAVPDTTYARRGIFDELDHAFRILKRVIEEETGHAAPTSDAKEADAEDELYKAVKSAIAEPGKSLGTLIKTVTGGSVQCKVGGRGEFSSETKTATSKTTGDEQPGAELRTVTKREEHVDFLGNLHVKTVTRTLNADGDEVARQTHYTVRSQRSPRGAGEQDHNQDGDDGDPWGDEDDDDSTPLSREGEAGKRNSENRRKGGWFWK